MDRPTRQSSSVGSRSPLSLPLLMLVLLAGGLILWGSLLPRAEESVFGRVPILDEVYYLDRAVELNGALCPPGPCFMSPLYPQLIRLAGSDVAVPADRVVPPRDLSGIRLLQVVCWMGTVLLLAWIGWRDLAPPDGSPGRRLASAALPALLFFLYRPAAAYTSVILVEMPLTFLVTVALALLPGPMAKKSPHPGRALAVGVALGLAGLLRGTALAVLPVAMGVLWLRARRHAGRAGVTAILTLVGAILVLLPASIHNSRLAGRPSPPTLNGGVNLYIGNGPDANGFYVAAVPGDWRHDPAGTQYLATRFDRSSFTLAQADSIWTALSRRSIGEDPGRAIGLWGKKVWLHLQAWEIDQLLPLEGWSKDVPAARVLFVSYGLLVALGLGFGLAGLIRRPGSPAAVWMLAVLALIALQSVFFVVGRYRLVLVPLWALLATGAVLDRRPGWWRRGLLVACGLLVTVPWGLGGVRQMWTAMAQANEGRRWAQVGEAEGAAADLERARGLFRQALAGGAPGPVPWRALIAADAALGDSTATVRDLDRALAAYPEDRDLLAQRVADLLTGPHPDQALPVLRRILATDPRDADALHNLAVLSAAGGDLASASAAATSLIRFHPLDARGYVDLGVIQVRQGNREKARATFQRGLERIPDSETLARNIRVLDTRQAP
ncbi:hypothetical protein COW53_04500 [bacterium CG17_big_fil_post_rev_8_21_14_2_50_64_8]|nr:MAG: hypothetical protein COW53_04500 [bacterium CG17_big_fil_post_rev_8_21_14_2_50_64_8]